MIHYFMDVNLSILNGDDMNLVFVDGLDYWESNITEPNIEELSICFNVFKEDNA